MPITVHVYLVDGNAVKVHQVREATGKSANEIVNDMLAVLDAVDIEEIITMHVRDPATGSTRKIRKKRLFSVKFPNQDL